MSIQSELKENLEYISGLLPLTPRETDCVLMQFRYTQGVSLDDVFDSKEYDYGKTARAVARILLNRKAVDEPDTVKKQDEPEFGVNE